MRRQQRLVVCLDGTWNSKDDSTNVLHHFALTLKEISGTESAVTQRCYYDAGVGTGVLDSISGGAFGFGLEENVREAYDWLAEHYRDADASAEADEIYVFGFSRGAYTARSLVGFIASCGLVRHGAPISVTQLWTDYCTLGREREHDVSLWKMLCGAMPTKTQSIAALMRDAWRLSDDERQVAPGCSMAGQLIDDASLSSAERLLIRWSRRVRITYLGVYDTVGALGVDALAIPGLSSRKAMHHNMRPTSIIQRCRHALAIDEHRSSFRHTPFAEYIGDEPLTIGDIEQSWFVGAHSNVGGGYPDNELAQYPLRWLLEGAKLAGLECEPFPTVAPLTERLPRDSYMEFASPFWTMVVRGKRYYRSLDPEPEFRCKGVGGGYVLRTINERVHPSVLEIARQSPQYCPPNLLAYAQRRAPSDRAAPEATELAELLAPRDRGMASHVWPGGKQRDHVALVLWASIAAAGVVAMNKLFNSPAATNFSVALLVFSAFALTVIDWLESRMNRVIVCTPGPRARALLDSFYWLRTVGFVLFVCGSISAAVHLWAIGWNAPTLGFTWSRTLLEGEGAIGIHASAGARTVLATLRDWWLVPIAAAAAMLLARCIDRPARAWPRQCRSALFTLLWSSLAMAVLVMGVPLSGHVMAQILVPAVGRHSIAIDSPAPQAAIAGRLVLLQIGIVYLLVSLYWVDSAMRRANLPDRLGLQHRYRPASVWRQLEKWRRALTCPRWEAMGGQPAGSAMRELVREALWRDMVGLIPVHTIVLSYGLSFAFNELHAPWPWLLVPLVAPRWWLLPATAALADYIEDLCQLRYLTLHERGRSPSALLTLLASVATAAKFLAFFPSVVYVLVCALIAGPQAIAAAGTASGWRGTASLAIGTSAVLLLLLIFVVAPLYAWLRRKWEHERVNQSQLGLNG